MCNLATTSAGLANIPSSLWYIQVSVESSGKFLAPVPIKHLDMNCVVVLSTVNQILSRQSRLNLENA